MIQGILLDRDGTINFERTDYVRSLDQLVLLPGALEALVRLASLDAPILVVTNQSCVGRGVVPMATLDAIHQNLAQQVRAAGGRIDGFYVCPHRPEEGCECRKPRPGLLQRAMREHGLKPGQCLMIGDSPIDAGAARAANVECILVRTGRSDLRNISESADSSAGQPGLRVMDSLYQVSELLMDEVPQLDGRAYGS